MKVSIDVRLDAMPRTVFYERYLEAVRRSPRFVEDSAEADLIVPQEDTACESNWPFYGDAARAYLRGAESDFYDHLNDYIALLEQVAPKRLLYLNMHPLLEPQPSLARRDEPHMLVADGSLVTHERAWNPRTVSFPPSPLIVGGDGAPQRERTILASFRGRGTHPVRNALSNIADGEQIVCELVTGREHFGRIDALAQVTDQRYVDLLEASWMAFVPRGEAHFSYRLLEVMSFGCVPVVLSDGWVLPFDRLIEWDTC